MFFDTDVGGAIRGARARIFAGTAATILALAFSTTTTLAIADAPPPCNAWDVEYTLNAKVKITDTMAGAGDGVHTSGPGHLRVRFDNVNGAPGGAAKLTDYQMSDHFFIAAKVLLFEANITADSISVTTPNACGVSAEGTLAERTLRWGTWNGLRSDGTIKCDGSLCGRFGGPPSGTSETHYPPHGVTFKPFEFSDDRKTFTMDYVVVSKKASPSQTSQITLAGREVSRTCVVAKPCP